MRDKAALFNRTNKGIAVGFQICEISRNSRESELIAGQGHPRSSISVTIESAYRLRLPNSH